MPGLLCEDEAWLRLLNAERKKENLGPLSTDLFENIMDQIEKEWFDLVSLSLKSWNPDYCICLSRVRS